MPSDRSPGPDLPTGPDVPTERDQLAEQIGAFRRAALPGLLLELAGGFAGLELSLTQISTLYLLSVDHEHGRSPTVRGLAERIGRSLSATSRLLEQLVAAGLVDRRTDATDRRAKRLALTEHGRRTLREFEHTRATAQLRVTQFLDAEQQRRVADGMALLALAARRLRDATGDHSDTHPADAADPAAG